MLETNEKVDNINKEIEDIKKNQIETLVQKVQNQNKKLNE